MNRVTVMVVAAAVCIAAQSGRWSVAQADDQIKVKTSYEAEPSFAQAQQLVGQAVETVFAGSDLDDLGQHLATADRNRLTELDEDQGRLNYAADRLQQAYRERFGSELQFAGTDAIFDSAMVRIDAQPSAQPAAARMEPSDGQTSVQVHTDGTADTNVTVRADSDQAAAEAQTDVAAADQAAARAAAEDRGADPTGDRIKPESKGMRADQPAGYDEAAKDLQSAEERAEIASARASDAQVVMSIESSGGLPQARLDLIREGDAWKIDLDDSVSDAELTSNLARHLEQAVAGIDQWPQDAAGARQAIAHHVVLGLSSP